MRGCWRKPRGNASRRPGPWRKAAPPVPTGNRYGDAAGHSCIAVAGAAERAITLETGSSDRVANMHAFSAAALDLLAEVLAA